MPHSSLPSWLTRATGLLLGLLAAASPPTATASALAVQAVQVVQVVQQIVLIRHGIRAPTKSPDALAIYAAKPWVGWPVAPGQLTPHGAALMRALGGWYRNDLARAGLALGSCREPGRLALIADSTPRNRASGEAMLDGLLPGCRAGYRAFAPGHVDPLFHGVDTGENTPGSAAPVLPMAALVELQQVLLGCHDKACLTAARAAGKQPLLGEKPAKALKNAGSLSENLMLEYAQGMPLAQVGWGRLDAAGVGRIIRLHNAQFAYAKKNPQAARARGGNLLAHITATLTAAAGGHAALTPLVPDGVAALVLVGHDTDLASQAGLLGLDWDDPAQPDDYPPGGALIFQLLRSPDGYSVRLRIALPTLAALRAADTSGAGAMYVRTLRLAGCGQRERCPLARFQALVAQRTGGDTVIAGSGDEPTAH